MFDNEKKLDWLILTHGEFLLQFGIDRYKIITEYSLWKDDSSNHSIIKFFCELLRQASLYNIKNAQSEEEFYNSKLLLDTMMFEHETSFDNTNKNFLLGQIHFDKLLIARLTLPFNFDVQIDTRNCCPYCAKKDKLVFSFEKVIKKKYLPFSKCKREEGCCCTYSIVPLYDENDKLIPKDAL